MSWGAGAVGAIRGENRVRSGVVKAHAVNRVLIRVWRGGEGCVRTSPVGRGGCGVHCKVEEPAPTALGEDWNPTGDSQPRLLKLAAGLEVGTRNPRGGGRGGLSTGGG